jgi:hypothetical protein
MAAYQPVMLACAHCGGRENKIYLYTLDYLYHYRLDPCAVYIWRDSIRCKKIKLLITTTFAESWIEIQQPIICGLTEYMVGCAWSELHRLSPFALDSLTLNFSYTETSADIDMRRYFVELYGYITYSVSEHQCLVPVTLDRSVCSDP